MKNIFFFLFSAIIFSPFVVSAQGIGDIMDSILYIALMLISIFGTLSFVAFFYGLALFLFNHEEKTINEKGKNIMVWGIVALFVLVSIWGIIGFIQNTIGNTEGPQGVVIVPPRVI